MDNSDDTPSIDADPIDEEAAQIDPRSPDVAEQIADLVEDAQALGRDADQPTIDDIDAEERS
jgi:hypothetical protein